MNTQAIIERGSIGKICSHIVDISNDCVEVGVQNSQTLREVVMDAMEEAFRRGAASARHHHPKA